MTASVGSTARASTGGAALPAPVAPRLRRPSWRDPRLLVGLLLVLSAVVVGARVVSAADETEPYYVAVATLTPGDAVGSADVRVVRARLQDVSPGYLSAASDLPAGMVASRVSPPGSSNRRGHSVRVTITYSISWTCQPV